MRLARPEISVKLTIRRTLQEAIDLYASQAIAHAKPRRFLPIYLVAFDGRAKGHLAKYEGA